MPSVFVLLLFAFSIWMLFDAIRRGAELYWYAIILLLPLGAVIYFLFVKLGDYDLVGLGTRRATQPAISQLRQRAAASPTVENTLALAEALEERTKYAEAASTYQQVLAESSSNPAALHGLARCKLSMNQPDEAVELLGRLIETDRGFADFSAALDYAEALWQNGQEDDAVDLAGALAEHTGRPNHRLAQAHYLAGTGATARATQVVDAVIEELEAAPPEGGRASKWLKKARAMKAGLE